MIHNGGRWNLKQNRVYSIEIVVRFFFFFQQIKCVYRDRECAVAASNELSRVWHDAMRCCSRVWASEDSLGRCGTTGIGSRKSRSQSARRREYSKYSSHRVWSGSGQPAAKRLDKIFTSNLSLHFTSRDATQTHSRSPHLFFVH